MIEVAIMIEGQNGLNWPRWQRLAQAVEDLGFAGLYRSDHFTNSEPPDMDSLELWVSLTWLASHTRRIDFGSLVSPVSFRHPVHTARMASAVDDLSAGRLVLGMGAGWNVREHELFGWDLLETEERFARFQEGLEVVTRLLHSNEAVNFEGRFYQLRGAILLPRPQRVGGPPILIGGNGVQRTLPLAARYADEWNSIYTTPGEFARLSALLDELLQAEGRRPADVRHSLMEGCVFGQDEMQLKARVAARGGGDIRRLRQHGVVAGTVPEIVDQLGQFAQAGVQRIMLQWLDLDDIDGLEAMATGVLPQVGN